MGSNPNWEIRPMMAVIFFFTELMCITEYTVVTQVNGVIQVKSINYFVLLCCNCANSNIWVVLSVDIVDCVEIAWQGYGYGYFIISKGGKVTLQLESTLIIKTEIICGEICERFTKAKTGGIEVTMTLCVCDLHEMSGLRVLRIIIWNTCLCIRGIAFTLTTHWC